MKQEGIDYDERMELLEEVTYPKPLADELEVAFEIYRGGHPWVADEELSPKSIARDLSERAMTFVEYVGFYSLARSQGLVLRYLADAFKALRRTVPEAARTEELEDLISWLGELVRQSTPACSRSGRRCARRPSRCRPRSRPTSGRRR